MRKLLLTGAILLNSILGRSQFTPDDIVYYVGEGPDTAVFVLDFLDGTSDSCYVWGYLFDAALSVSGGDMLAAIAADEDQLTINTGGGFLNDIYYNNHLGEAGAPNYWGTWSKTDETDWVTNSGLSEVLANGDWFGCSYTDFDPAIVPGEPIPAYASARYSEEMVQFWVGEGANKAVFVIDFVIDVYGEAVSYAWGYRFDGTTDGATMLADIASEDVNLTINAGPFLNDILFNGLQGLAGDPNYWATWSGTNLSDWTMNAGLATEINDGDWFGCSYADWPPRRPFYPISALDSTAFTFGSTTDYGGFGPNKVMLVLDFNEWNPDHSYAFEYHFETETITGEEVMIGLEEAGIFGLGFDLTGGFLNEVGHYPAGEYAAGGAPNYWSTWSATNVGGWVMNGGISEVLTDGDWFGCSYTAWNPATPPSMPVEGFLYWSIEKQEGSADLSVYPNPVSTECSLLLHASSSIHVMDLQGRLLVEQQGQVGINTIDVSKFEAGSYLLLVWEEGVQLQQIIVVQ